MTTTRQYLFALVAAIAILPVAGCGGGGISSVGIPAEAPYEEFITFVVSPWNDLTAVATGPHMSTVADLYDIVDGLFLYAVIIEVDRDNYVAGGVELVSDTMGTVGGFALTIESANTPIQLTAAYTEGLIPSDENGGMNDSADGANLWMRPTWDVFDAGELWAEGVNDGPVALCDTHGGYDIVVFRLDAFTELNTAGYDVSGTCGDALVNIVVNPPFDTVGECISTLIGANCHGLKGKDRSACNRAQIGVCHASFNVPSAHVD